MPPLFVFILAGGSGERFWPLSRTPTPKHLLRLLGERTLLEETLLRFRGIVPDDHLFVLTNAQQIEGCRAAVPWLPATQFVAEPAKRDTAPATALAVGLAQARDPEAICALFPADAMIHDIAAFQKNFSDAVELSTREDALITFAIPSTEPATGYGYLELGDLLPPGTQGSSLRRVRRFVEKPDLAKAKAYLATGNYAWNAGMFVWQARVFLEEARRNAPALADFIAQFPLENTALYLEEKFPALPKISVDFAILEKASSVLSVQAEFDWDDVGSWTALPRHFPQDTLGNTVRGTASLLDSRDSIVVSTSGRTVALCGVHDLVIVETADALLVCSRDAVERIKSLQPHLPPEVR